MKPLFAATLAISMMLAAGAAMAHTAIGTVMEVNTETNEVMLQNGHQFHFPATVDLSAVSPGEDVLIRYEMVGGRSEASSIEIEYHANGDSEDRD